MYGSLKTVSSVAGYISDLFAKGVKAISTLAVLSRTLKKTTSDYVLYLVILTIPFLGGCWEQNDEITISENGAIKFETKIIVPDTDKYFSFKDMDEMTKKHGDDLTKAGWHIKRTWISKNRPYTLTYSGEADISSIKPKSLFYELVKKDEKNYKLIFNPIGSKEEHISRKIVVNNVNVDKEFIVKLKNRSD